MDLATGARNRIPVAQLIRRTLKEIEPHARELGSERELEGIGEILARGNGSDRQLRVFNANRDIVEVVEEIAKATEAVEAPAEAVYLSGRQVDDGAPEDGMGRDERPPVRAPQGPLREIALVTLLARRQHDAHWPSVDEVERVHERGVRLRVDVERQQPPAVRRRNDLSGTALHPERVALPPERAGQHPVPDEVRSRAPCSCRRRSSAVGRESRRRLRSSRRRVSAGELDLVHDRPGFGVEDEDLRRGAGETDPAAVRRGRLRASRRRRDRTSPSACGSRD